MAMTARERLIAVGLAGVVGLYSLNSFVIQPYRAALADVETQIDAKTKKRDQDRDVIDRQAKLQKTWELMGVKVTPAEADTRLSHYLNQWQRDARVTFTNVKPERSMSENKGFAQITTHATASGQQKDLVWLIWAISNAPIPLKVNEIVVSSKKDGSDDLQMTFSVSTLCVDPDAGKTSKGGRASVAMSNRPTTGRDPS